MSGEARTAAVAILLARATAACEGIFITTWALLSAAALIFAIKSSRILTMSSDVPDSCFRDVIKCSPCQCLQRGLGAFLTKRAHHDYRAGKLSHDIQCDHVWVKRSDFLQSFPSALC